jgi:type IV pilus assembly protein PilF
MLLSVLLLQGCASDGLGGDRTQSEDPDNGMLVTEPGTPRERARVHTELAAAYFGRGNMAVALDEARIAMRADPGYAMAYNVLGLVHMDLKETTQAQQNFERALRLLPNDPDINHNFGWFLCQTGRQDMAMKHFQSAVRNPLYATPQRSYSLAGECLLQIGREAEAIDQFERALRADAGHVPAILKLAMLRHRRGEWMQARELLTRFNSFTDSTAESTWLALRVARRLGDASAEAGFANEMRRRFVGTPEYELLVNGRYE